MHMHAPMHGDPLDGYWLLIVVFEAQSHSLLQSILHPLG